MNAYIIPGLKERSLRLKRLMKADDISKSILEHFNVSFEEVTKKSRKHTIITVRFIVCYMLRKHTDMTLMAIAYYLSPAIRDHTTVIHAVRFIEGQLSSKFDNHIKDIFNEIYI